MSKRRFVCEEAAAVVATQGVQTAQDRFGKRLRRSDYEDNVPAIAPWRCCLTGLSQTSNHYFVAYSDKIFVFVPQYSTQALPQDPALIVTSQPSRPGLQGYLDRRNPHAINNLVVHFLGEEEIVAVVRDDGDVTAFLVRHIVQAVERRAYADSSIGLEADDVRPVFQSNVGMSAWGLAIHAEARIVAVSANTHNITIFKFGLVDHGDEDWDAREDDKNKEFLDRRMDVTQQVLNGTSNIPHIAFCNTGDDPNAQWLLTTDITGYCRTIDLFEKKAAQTFRFGPPANYLNSNEHDPINSGWFVGFLDRRSFIRENDIHAALGMEETESLPSANGSSSMWDIGATVAHIPDTNSRFSAPRDQRRCSRRRGLHSDSGSGLQSLTAESQAADTSEQESLDGGVELPQEDVEMADSDEFESEELASGSDSGDSSYWVDDYADFEDEGTEDSPSFSAMYGGRRIYGNEPRSYQSYNGLCGTLPCPILHASVRSVYLLQPESQYSDSPFTSPTVGFTNALHQLVQGEFSYLNVFERLNMHAYIPAIGIIIFASQKGRALVISLTKLVNRGPHLKSGTFERPTDPRTTFAMRLERILPFASQEEAGQRPFAPLAGIATGPMQGTENLPDEQRRWRLMMYYADHTVFSYEISRRRTRDVAVDIQGVVV